jgi:MFS family permease
MTTASARPETPASAPPVAPDGPAGPVRPARAVNILMPACSVLVVALVAAVNLSVPKLSAGALHPSPTALLWIVDAYVLVFGCLLIPAGAVGDRHGRKGCLLAGLGVVAAGCLVAAAAPNIGVLLAGRVLTGAGAAFVMPATLSLMLQTAPPARRAHAVATWTAATGIAGITGNVGGGLVLEYLPWQALFLAVALVALALAALTAAYAPRGERHPARPDPLGSLLLTVAIAALLFAVIEGPERGWTSPAVVGGAVTALAVGAAFVGYGVRSPRALVDPRLFRNPAVRAGVVGVGVGFFGLFSLFFINAQYLQYAKGFSPLVTGVAILPLAVGMLLISRRSVGWTARFGARRVVGAGLATTAAGLALLSLATAATPYPLYAVYLVVMSAGMGLAMPPLSSLVVTAVPREKAGLGSGLNGAAREVGSALGVAVFGSVFASRFAARTPGGRTPARALADSATPPVAGGVPWADHAHVVAAFTGAMSAGFRVVCVLVILSIPAVLRGLRAAAA